MKLSRCLQLARVLLTMALCHVVQSLEDSSMSSGTSVHVRFSATVPWSRHDPRPQEAVCRVTVSELSSGWLWAPSRCSDARCISRHSYELSGVQLQELHGWTCATARLVVSRVTIGRVPRHDGPCVRFWGIHALRVADMLGLFFGLVSIQFF